MHLYFEPKRSDLNQKETNKFLNLVERFPNQDFIIAHAGTYYPEVFLHAKNRSLNNVYTETSVAFSSFNPKISNYRHSYKKLTNILREFGIEKILYGSDAFILHPLSNGQMDLFLEKEVFNENELEKILVQNGNHFLLKHKL